MEPHEVTAGSSHAAGARDREDASPVAAHPDSDLPLPVWPDEPRPVGRRPESGHHDAADPLPLPLAWLSDDPAARSSSLQAWLDQRNDVPGRARPGRDKQD